MAPTPGANYMGWRRDRGNNRLDFYYGATRIGHINANGMAVVGTFAPSGNITAADDALLGIGTGNTARLSWDTTDANANALLLQMPAGGSVDVPVLAIGQSIESVDLGLFDSVVDPHIAMFGVGAVTTGPRIRFYKARGTIASPTVITAGDDIGQISAYSCVAAGEYVEAARIAFDGVATQATTRGPGTITFSTATDAAPSVLTAALTIGKDQKCTMASADVTGDLKINLTLTAGADGVGADGEQLTSGGAAAPCDWASDACLREFKHVERERTDADAVLALMVQTPVYDFRYKRRDEYNGHLMGTGDAETTYVGVMADDAPWATHHHGRILSPINTFGHTVLAIKALQAEIDDLRAQLSARGN